MMDKHSIYRWPKGTALFCLIGLSAPGILMAAQPAITHLPAGKVVVAAYFLASTLLCVYLYRFRIIVDATSVSAGAFLLRKMEFADVVRARHVQGNDSGQIILFDGHGRRIRIRESIHDFAGCANAISSRLPGHPLLARGTRNVPADVLSGSDLV